MNFSYSSGVISPLLNLFLWMRISRVCGKDPIVVVGNSGNLRCSCCWPIRVEKGDMRLCISSVTDACLSFTLGSFVHFDEARAWTDLALASSSSLTAAG